MKFIELLEDEDSDQFARLAAREAADTIVEWLEKYGEAAYKKLQKTTSGYKISASSLGLPYKNLTIYFGQGEDAASYGNIAGDPDKKVILMKIIRTASDIKNLDIRFKKNKNIFVHEFIHYLDDQKISYSNTGVSQDYDWDSQDDWKRYINSPEEYNAYYQQAIAKLEDRLDEFESKMEGDAFERLRKFLLNMNTQEFVEWFKSKNANFFHNEIVDYFNEKYGRKLDKRLARFFKENILPRLTEITEASRIGTGIHKNEIPERYKKYPLINRGTTSAILEVDPETVLMLTKDSIKKDYLVHKLGIAEMVEVFDSRHPKLGNMDIYVLKMPKLYPLSKENRKIARDLEELLRRMNRTAHKMNSERDIGDLRRMPQKQITRHYKENILHAFWNYFEDEYNEFKNGDHILRQLIDFLSDYDVDQYEWDLRQGNFMQTKDGELVVLDPIVDKEILNVFRNMR